MAEVEVQVSVNADLFEYEIRYKLRRNGVLIPGTLLTLREKKGLPSAFTPAIETFVPNLTFTDVATGSPILYEIHMCVAPMTGGAVGRTVGYRALNAIIFD
jgi:hypothetical protein